MVPMQWKPELSLGIQEIDQQHMAIINKFAEAQKIVEGRHNWTVIDSALVDLSQTARRNFEFEESLMRLLGIPDVDKHKALHEQFFAKMSEIESSSIRGVAVAENIQRLYDWFVDHVHVADRRDYAKIVSAVSQVVKSKR